MLRAYKKSAKRKLPSTIISAIALKAMVSRATTPRSVAAIRLKIAHTAGLHQLAVTLLMARAKAHTVIASVLAQIAVLTAAPNNDHIVTVPRVHKETMQALMATSLKQHQHLSLALAQAHLILGQKPRTKSATSNNQVLTKSHRLWFRLLYHVHWAVCGPIYHGHQR